MDTRDSFGRIMLLALLLAAAWAPAVHFATPRPPAQLEPVVVSGTPEADDPEATAGKPSV